MSKTFTIIKAIFIGITNIIPGISGGTVAVVFKLYHRLIEAVDLFTKHPIKALISIWDILVGILIGLLLGFVVLSYTYELWPVALTLFFIGLLIGGLKPILDKVKGNINILNLAIMVVSFTLLVVLPILPQRTTIDNGLVYFIVLFVVGLIAAFAGFAPGISGSLMIMILGYYQHVLELGKNIFESIRTATFDGILDNMIPLVILFAGLVAGFFISIKTIKKILKSYETPFYFSVLGMLVASPISIMLLINKTTPLHGVVSSQWVIGFGLLVLGFIISYVVIVYSENKENQRRLRNGEVITTDSEGTNNTN